jgi:hypothetical protein
MEEHPGIAFRDGPSGRRAALAGGPDVWEVIVTLHNTDSKGEDAVLATAGWAALNVAQVRAAVRYPPSIADGLRARGHDTVAVVERPELRSLSDPDVFAHAQGEQRTVVTENVADYVRIGQRPRRRRRSPPRPGARAPRQVSAR